MLRFKIKAECSKPVNLTTHFVFTVAAENKKIQQGNSVVHVNSFNWRTAAAAFFFFLQSYEEKILWPSHVILTTWPAVTRGKGRGKKKKKSKRSLWQCLAYCKWLKDFYWFCPEFEIFQTALWTNSKAHQDIHGNIDIWCKIIPFVLIFLL